MEDMDITAVTRGTGTATRATDTMEVTTAESIMATMELIDITEADIMEGTMDRTTGVIVITSTMADITADTVTGTDMVGTTETEVGAKRGNGAGIGTTESITTGEVTENTTDTTDIMAANDIMAGIMEATTARNIMAVTGTTADTVEDITGVTTDTMDITVTAKDIAGITAATAITEVIIDASHVEL